MSKTPINDFLNLNAVGHKPDYEAALERIQKLAKESRREYAGEKRQLAAWKKRRKVCRWCGKETDMPFHTCGGARPQHNDP